MVDAPLDVVILANGLSTRLGCEPPDAKTLTPLLGRPLLVGILAELRGLGFVRGIQVHLRRGVRLSPEVRSRVHESELRWHEPRGYFRDVAESIAADRKTVVIDSDLAAPPGSIRSFLRSFALDDADLAVGYQFIGDRHRGRDIWIQLDAAGRVARLGREVEPTGFATVGVFGWTPASRERALHEVAVEPSVTRYISRSVERGMRVSAIPFAAAVNVNSDPDLAHAEAILEPLRPRG